MEDITVSVLTNPEARKGIKSGEFEVEKTSAPWLE